MQQGTFAPLRIAREGCRAEIAAMEGVGVGRITPPCRFPSPGLACRSGGRHARFGFLSGPELALGRVGALASVFDYG